MAVVNYSITQILEIDEQIKTELDYEPANLHEKDLTKSEEQCAVQDVLPSENQDSDCKGFTGREISG